MSMSLPDDQMLAELIQAARKAREAAYAPYSDYRVGAALRSPDGEVFCGCNVENVSYGLTICAERCAVGNAISAGCRHFDTLVVCTADGGSPCGACRQVLAEFGQQTRIVTVDAEGAIVLDTTIAELLPTQFDSGLDRAP